MEDSVRKKRGRVGEDAVCRYLEQRGYIIVKRNYRKRCGELDIIARKDDILAVVEVKTRKFGTLCEGYEAVDKRKQIKIIKTTDLFQSEYEDEVYVRFDIADVSVTTEENPQVLGIEYFEGAFDASGIFTFN